jgi:flagellar biosynthetic protein FliS
MNLHEASALYRESSLENAPPIKIVRTLYERALRLLEQAAACDPKGSRSEFVDALARTDEIVTELRFALSHEHAPQVSRELERLYLFVESRIQTALRDRDPAPLADARAVLAKLHSAWSEVALDGPTL